MSTKPLRRLPYRPPPQPADSPAWNVYRCEKCSSFYVTVMIDEGVTPFLLRCMDRPVVTEAGQPARRGGCDGTMRSQFFPSPEAWPPLAHRTADGEFYYPSDEEWRILQKRKQSALFDHVKNGGLLLRPPSASYQFPSITSSTTASEEQ